MKWGGAKGEHGVCTKFRSDRRGFNPIDDLDGVVE